MFSIVELSCDILNVMYFRELTFKPLAWGNVFKYKRCDLHDEHTKSYFNCPM